MRGTPNYIAPEVITKRIVTHASDIWALGCVAYAACEGSLPFEGVNTEETLQNILKGSGKTVGVGGVVVIIEDLHFGATTVPAGAVLYPCVGAANHDPAQFGHDADRIRVDRPAAAHHLQFGTGIHACVGTHLARLEIEVTLRRLLARFGSLELAAEPTWSPRMVLRSVNELHLNYDI